jgi:hypothetical protein
MLGGMLGRGHIMMPGIECMLIEHVVREVIKPFPVLVGPSGPCNQGVHSREFKCDGSQ